MMVAFLDFSLPSSGNEFGLFASDNNEKQADYKIQGISPKIEYLRVRLNSTMSKNNEKG